MKRTFEFFFSYPDSLASLPRQTSRKSSTFERNIDNLVEMRTTVVSIIKGCVTKFARKEFLGIFAVLKLQSVNIEQ